MLSAGDVSHYPRVVRAAAWSLPVWGLLAVVLGWGAVAVAAAPAAEDDAGFVLRVEGTWFLEATSPQKLSGGQKLPVGATIYPQQPGPKTFLVVCLYTGEAKTYTTKTTLPKRYQPSLLSRIWAAVQGQQRGGVVHAVSRGDDLTDGVARITLEGIAVGPLMEKLPAGDYLLRFSTRRPAAGKADDAPPVLATIHWDPDAEKNLADCKLAAGLYTVDLLDKRAKQPTGSEALLLVCNAATYDAQVKAYADAQALTKAWDEQTRKYGAGLFLESFLESLADGNSIDSNPADKSDPADQNVANENVADRDVTEKNVADK